MSNSQRPLLPHWQPTPGGIFSRTDAYMERREKEGPGPVDSDPTSFSAIEEELAKDLLKRCSTVDIPKPCEPVSNQDTDLREQKAEPIVMDQASHHHAGTHSSYHIPLDRRAAILALRWYSDKTWVEISKCLGVSPTGAREVVKRAKTRAGEGADFEAVYRCLESKVEKEHREHERLKVHKTWHMAG